ncbi:MAG: response regulator transcription factor [Gloeobacteraceae cyanobacterium ES-bin-316]|nr:response regulator transcription factor [Ferruginibacter sp.]
MTDIRALIIDDESAAVKTLSLMIKHYLPGITTLQTTSDAFEGLQLLRSFEPHLLFIDIQMPVMNGFELLKQVERAHFSIIFTTAHDEYAIDAIRFSALDYLLKPIDADELQHAFNRFLQKQSHQDGNVSLYNNFVYNLNVKEKKDFKLALPTAQGTFFHKPENIIRLEGVGNYTKFFFADKTTLLISHTIKNYEDILTNYGFIRIHKSHLVNKQHVVNYMVDGMLTMSDSSRVEVSRRRKEDVLEVLKNKA